MTRICLVFSLCMVFTILNAQNAQVLRQQKLSLLRTINFSDPAMEDWDAKVQNIKAMPEPASDYGNKKEVLQKMRNEYKASSHKTGSNRDATPAPLLASSFDANNSQGTPNDNHMAISNGGKIISVVNTNLRVYDEAGTQLLSRSLGAFANSLGLFLSISDPRVVYDPVADRFIVCFFNGSTSVNSTIIVAFSQTNDPVGNWNFYQLDGCYLNDTTWSDYPIVSLSDNDFFMTFNQLKDGLGWQEGFRYSVIWQIDKAKGYAGDSLEFNYWYNINHDGKSIWSVCPAQGGDFPTGNQSYFLSVRPGDLNNDTVFLHTITDSYASGNAQFSTKVLVTPTPYGLPPSAAQKDGQYLATNDARVLSAMVQNNKIQYVQNCKYLPDVTAGLYVGQIDNPNTASPTISGEIIGYDTIELGYPSIAYIGNGAFDNRSVITCSYITTNSNPGTAAFYRDANGNISDMLIVKEGVDVINVLGDTLERWGDYTGIQKKYNEPNTAWLSGSFGHTTNRYLTVVAKLVNSDSSFVSSIKPVDQVNAKVFPNPASDYFSLQFDLPKGNFTNIALFDGIGKLIRILIADSFKTGTNLFTFSTSYLSNGTYYLQINNNGSVIKTEKLVISR
jgi:hypothetical protein